MAALLNPLDDPAAADNTTASGAVNTNTAGSSGATAGSTSSGTGAAVNPTATPSQTPTNPNSQDVGQIGALNQGFNFSPLLDTVRGQGTAARGAITSANSDFNTGLGAAPVFGSAQQNALTSVINGTDSNVQDGVDILNYNPTAPRAINNGSYDPLVAQYQHSAQETSNQGGVNDLLTNLRPDLTPGERAFDSNAYSANPDFQNQSKGLVDDSNAVYGLAKDTTDNAGKAVGQRANDVGAFQTAAKGFVNSQLTNINNAIQNEVDTANAKDQVVHEHFNSLNKGDLGLSQVPYTDLAFDRTGYQPMDFAGLQPGNNFDEKVDPNQFLQYNPSALADASNTATPQQIAQYNNAERVLGSNSLLTAGSPRTAASIGINAPAWQTAMKQALARRDTSDAQWLLAHPPAPTPAADDPTAVAAPVVAVAGLNAQGPDGGGGSDGGGGGGGSDGGAGDGGAGDGGAGDGGGDGGEHKGGFVKNIPRPNVPVVRRNYETGGSVPMDAGPRGIDTVPTNVNNGEFVVRTPSSKILGQQDLTGINQLNTATPQQQARVRDALHAALTRHIAQRGMS